MKKINYYLAITAKDPNEKYYAFVRKVSSSENIASILSEKHILHANIYPKSEAEKIVDFWNDSYKNNGTYAF